MPADRTRHSRRVQLKAMGHESKPMVKPRAGLSTNSISPPPRRKGTDCVATQKLPRTPNKFMCFRSSALAQMQYKGALQHHLSIKIAKLWNIMSEEQREPFKKQADKLKSDQLEALASAKSNPTPPRTGGPTMTAESHYRGVQWDGNLKLENGPGPQLAYYRPHTQKQFTALCSGSEYNPCPGTAADAAVLGLNDNQLKTELIGSHYRDVWQWDGNLKVETGPGPQLASRDPPQEPCLSLSPVPCSDSWAAEYNPCPGTTVGAAALDLNINPSETELTNRRIEVVLGPLFPAVEELEKSYLNLPAE